jgi:hypothetical protein
VSQVPVTNHYWFLNLPHKLILSDNNPDLIPCASSSNLPPIKSSSASGVL